VISQIPTSVMKDLLRGASIRTLAGVGGQPWKNGTRDFQPGRCTVSGSLFVKQGNAKVKKGCLEERDKKRWENQKTRGEKKTCPDGDRS